MRFGLGIRALRRRRRWTQAEARRGRPHVSRSVIARDRARSCPTEWRCVRSSESRRPWARRSRSSSSGRARVSIVSWTRAMRTSSSAWSDCWSADGWRQRPRSLFNIAGERGSIDVLAFHRATGALLVIEVKSVVPDLQATLHGLDRKSRVAPDVAEARGSDRYRFRRVLVLPNDRTSGADRDAQVDLRRRLPGANTSIRRWCWRPIGVVAGSCSCQMAARRSRRHRVRSATSIRRRATQGSHDEARPKGSDRQLR